MGDSRKAIAEDISDYESLCRKWHMRATDNPYGDHASWLKLIDQGKTRESFTDYQQRMAIERLASSVDNKRAELEKLESDLKQAKSKMR